MSVDVSMRYVGHWYVDVFKWKLTNGTETCLHQGNVILFIACVNVSSEPRSKSFVTPVTPFEIHNISYNFCNFHHHNLNHRMLLTTMHTLKCEMWHTDVNFYYFCFYHIRKKIKKKKHDKTFDQ